MNYQFYPLKGYEGLYEICEQGIVRRISRIRIDSLNRRTILKQKVIKINIDKRSDYPVIKLSKSDGKYGSQYLHRLLALTFIPKPTNKNIVNHLDGNKYNYHLDNLEWTTPSENHLHAIKNNLIKLPYDNHIAVRNNCTEISYTSIRKAARLENLDYYRLKRMLNNKIPNTTCFQKVD